MPARLAVGLTTFFSLSICSAVWWSSAWAAPSRVGGGGGGGGGGVV